MNHEALVLFLVTVAVLSGFAGFLLFYVGSDAPFKRRYFPWWLGFEGLLFICFVPVAGMPVAVLLFWIPAVALVLFQNFRNTAFCHACGKTVVEWNSFSRAEFCSGCGERLPD